MRGFIYGSFLLGLTVFVAVAQWAHAADEAPPDLIVHHGQIVTVDAGFSIKQAMAVREGRIVAVGTDADVLALKGAATQVLDLGGKMVLPGLIDSHVHPAAAMTEFDHAIPEMESVADVL